MTSIKARARKLAEWILKQNETRTYRDIAQDFPPIVKAGTLNRIAKTKGQWMPKAPEILVALGLKEIRVPKVFLPGEKRTKRKIAKMAKRTREAIKWKER